MANASLAGIELFFQAVHMMVIGGITIIGALAAGFVGAIIALILLPVFGYALGWVFLTMAVSFIGGGIATNIWAWRSFGNV